MTLTRDDLIAIERAVVAGWPAIETEYIDGWIARWSSGGSVRANSVAAIDFTGPDLDHALARVVDFYRARGGVPKFTITDVAAPASLDTALAQRGWRRTGDHVTMAKELDPSRSDAPSPPSTAHPTPINVDLLFSPTSDWIAVYLQGLDESRRGVALRLVEGTPRPRAFFLASRDDEAIASGLTVIDGPLASVQCMATVPAARRTGAASVVLAAIERHVKTHHVCRIYLQTDADNHAARTLYERAGFRVIGHYHTRELTT